MDRRAFLRRAAVTGMGVVWAAPVVQTIAATPAFASVNGTPQRGCFHSNPLDPSQGCMEACTSVGCTGKQCDGFGDPFHGPCSTYCNIDPGNKCCNAGLCNPANFHCSPGDTVATYSGPIIGC